MTSLPVSLTHTEKHLGWCFWGLQMLALPTIISLLVVFRLTKGKVKIV